MIALYRSALALSLSLLVTTLVGCGGGGATSGKSVYKTTGKITLEGAPLAGATVTFASQAGLPAAIGRTNSSGQYVLTTYDTDDGAAAGSFKVVVNKVSSAANASSGGDSEHGENYAPSGAAAHSDDGDGGSGSLVPKAYTTSATTPLSATVEPGGANVFDFDLK